MGFGNILAIHRVVTERDGWGRVERYRSGSIGRVAADCVGLSWGWVLAAAALVVLVAGGARAEPLSKLLPKLLQTHNLTAAAEADLAAASERIRVAMGGWYPQLNVTAYYGHERRNKPSGTDDTAMPPRKVTVNVTQLLWDFDLTPSTVRAAELTREQANEALEATRQNILLRGIVAYLNVLRAKQVVDFAISSESNIKKQAELESARVERGAGYSTDVLQAKAQLAGAQARRVQAEGALLVARNAYRAVFYEDVGNVSKMVKPVLPVGLLPASVDEAVEVAIATNPQLRASQFATEAAREAIVQSRASGFYPRLDAIGELNYKGDDAGTIGSQEEALAKVQLSWPFNLGLTATNTVRAAQDDYLALQKRLADARDIIEQQTRDAWDNLSTAKENAELLLNQANIAAEFLTMARKERQLGKRQLIDVLAAETTVVNAQSDAASAETDVSIAVFTLLTSMGLMDAQVTASLGG